MCFSRCTWLQAECTLQESSVMSRSIRKLTHLAEQLQHSPTAARAHAHKKTWPYSPVKGHMSKQPKQEVLHSASF